ncbi:Hypothetical predicted protein [Pelobates cultripes]|uniref:Uncharacterized protein n=1 Tax=Pelobates cultripes TaxID=61616 RepID=A0AAD1S5N3_PELCU|nr:Hypothetical predicted protein [Pelobates cultripes]
MPFFQSQRLQKRRRKTGAYYTPTILGLEDLLNGYLAEHIDTSYSPDLSNTQAHTPAIGRRSQKPQGTAAGRDIGTMLQKPAQPKPTPAAATPEVNLTSTTPRQRPETPGFPQAPKTGQQGSEPSGQHQSPQLDRTHTQAQQGPYLQGPPWAAQH